MSEHTPHSTANMLEITPVTLRRWCAAHAAFLSAGANPPERGEARRFTGRDIEVLKHVKSLRAQGKTEAKINEQLRTLTFPEIETRANEDDTSIVEASTDALEAPSNVLAPLLAHYATKAEVELLARSMRPNVWWFAVGVGVGLGAAVVAELFAMVASRGH